MNITPDYKRRIHIMGKPDETKGYMLKVYDAETSEQITNITRMVITLDARETNQADITYIEHDVNDKPVRGYDGPVFHTVTLDNPSINITAEEKN